MDKKRLFMILMLSFLVLQISIVTAGVIETLETSAPEYKLGDVIYITSSIKNTFAQIESFTIHYYVDVIESESAFVYTTLFSEDIELEAGETYLFETSFEVDKNYPGGTYRFYIFIEHDDKMIDFKEVDFNVDAPQIFPGFLVSVCGDSDCWLKSLDFKKGDSVWVGVDDMRELTGNSPTEDKKAQLTGMLVLPGDKEQEITFNSKSISNEIKLNKEGTYKVYVSATNPNYYDNSMEREFNSVNLSKIPSRPKEIKSILRNDGEEELSGKLSVIVQQKVSDKWQDTNIKVSEKVKLEPGEKINLVDYWRNKKTPNELGEYRIKATLLDDNGKSFGKLSGELLEAYYEFSVKLTIQAKDTEVTNHDIDVTNEQVTVKLITDGEGIGQLIAQMAPSKPKKILLDDEELLECSEEQETNCWEWNRVDKEILVKYSQSKHNLDIIFSKKKTINPEQKIKYLIIFLVSLIVLIGFIIFLILRKRKITLEESSIEVKR